MYRVLESAKLPGNFPAFAEEIATGIEGIYGAEAARNYRDGAADAIQSSLNNASSQAFLAMDGQQAAGILLAFERHCVGHISFVHVLESHSGRGVEARLIQACVRAFRAGGVDGIVSECIPLCTLDVHSTYQSLAFEHVARALMTADTAEVARGSNKRCTTPIPPSKFDEAAAVIADAYVGHPGRQLHVEVRREDTARAFIERVAAGEYGPAQAGYLRCVSRDDAQPAGVILGCQVAPDFGFILQVAVRRDCQRQGIGRSLVSESASCFHRDGLNRVALGVTLSSPARRLYESLGFSILRPVDAYAWWRA